jgi:hypothetical protein
MKHPNKKRTTRAKKPLIDNPKEAEKRLQELLEKDGSNPKAKEDFDRLLEEMAKGSR